MSLPAGWVYHTLALICPVAMAILVQYPGTRDQRVVLYPLGVVFAVLSTLSMGDARAKSRVVGVPESPFPALFASLTLIANASLVGLYAFNNEVYEPHPLPRPPRWPRLRASPIYRTLDILMSMDRKINYPPNPPLPLRPNTSFTIRKSLIRILTIGLLVDICTLPIYLFRNHGLYRPDGSRSFARLCENMGGAGINVAIVRFGWMMIYGTILLGGIQSGWEMVRLVGIGSGVWLEEEWPEVLDRPWAASSMTDLWGRRYHQLLRSYFHTLLSPFHLPKPIFVLSAFTLSAFHHLLIMYPITGTFNNHYFHFFTGCGLVCILERGIYKRTGRKMEGLTGRVWTWAWIFILSWKLLEDEVDIGLWRDLDREQGLVGSVGVRWLKVLGVTGEWAGKTVSD